MKKSKKKDLIADVKKKYIKSANENILPDKTYDRIEK